MSKVINPLTGRTVAVNGKIYRQLVNKGILTSQNGGALPLLLADLIVPAGLSMASFFSKKVRNQKEGEHGVQEVHGVQETAPILQLKPDESYTDTIRQEVNLLMVDDEYGKAKVIGSASYRATKYPGDLDFYEVLQYPITRDKVYSRFARKLIKTVNKIKKSKGHIFMEMKCGLDHRYKIDIGTCQNDVYTMSRSFPKLVKRFRRDKLLNQEEYETIMGIYKKTDKNQLDYETIKKIIRSHYILRWNWKEIKRGFKILPVSGEKYTLEKGFSEVSPINIEVINTVLDKYTESSNFFILTWRDTKTGKLYTLNASQNVIDHFLDTFGENLRQSIETLYYSKLDYNMIKLAKRYFSYARVFQDTELAEKVLPLLNGNIGLLSQLKSELTTLVKILKTKNTVSFRIIKKQLEDIKYKTANVIELDSETLENINRAIDGATLLKNITTDKDSRKVLTTQIDFVKKQFENICNTEGKKYLESVGLIPPPPQFTPVHKQF